MTNVDTFQKGIARYWPLLFIATVYLVFLAANPAVIVDLRSFSFDDGTYSHAYLLPFVIAFFYWQAWQNQQLQPKTNLFFFVLFLLALFCYVWLQFAQQTVLSRVIWPMVIMLALLSYFRFSLAIIVPTALLWFITPIWGSINSILQDISVAAVTFIMRFTTIPTYVEGNMVHIPAGIFEIADGCSGLRYFVVSLALSVIFSYLHLKRARSVLLFFTIAILGSLITNWLRIVGLILIGHFTDMQSEIIADHNMFGWFLYIPFIMLLFYVGGFLDKTQPETINAKLETSSIKLPTSVTVLAVLLVFSTTTLNLTSSGQLLYTIAAQPTEIPEQPLTLSNPSPVIVTIEQQTSRTYSENAEQIVYQHFMFSGTEASRNPNYYLNDVIPAGWKQVAAEYSNLGQWRRLQDPFGREALVLYWYQLGDNRITSDGQYRVARLKQALALKRASDLHWYFKQCSSPNCALDKERIKAIL
ncbi:exosortase [Alishewanella sp. SMS8]|uniref:exosortase n=1 Tax=Alishewanella sp. SMS8 TaxID=2994676 RepID=UPI002742380F|nr:exosortase [Alishewanella sp. SMS8]MDP5458163.1 exosortase [Alishewanella sp. SMS8]